MGCTVVATNSSEFHCVNSVYRVPLNCTKTKLPLPNRHGIYFYYKYPEIPDPGEALIWNFYPEGFWEFFGSFIRIFLRPPLLGIRSQAIFIRTWDQAVRNIGYELENVRIHFRSASAAPRGKM